MTTITTPTVGDGATISAYSDRYAGTIIAVSPSGKRITVQRDNYRRIDSNGMSDAQSYEYERDPKGVTYQFSLRKNGRWVQVGETLYGGLRCHIGVRSAYYDYSF